VAAVYARSVDEPDPDAPLVEAYVTGTDLPPFHRALLEVGSLLHHDVRDPDFTMAELFDGEPGPDGRPQDVVEVDAQESERLLELLRAGKPVLTLPRGRDLFGDPAAAREGAGEGGGEDAGEGDGDPVGRPTGTDVPLDLRTDGRWIWSEASAYYLERYGFAPSRAFLTELRSRTGAPAPPSDVLVHLAREWLRQAGLG
jgi:hypothetical protein